MTAPDDAGTATDQPAPRYDSRVDTLSHSLRVGTLVGDIIAALLQRATAHDLSKTLSPEVEVFDEFSQKLAVTAYGSDQYWAHLTAMKPALAHHYANNAHHPEHYPDGIAGMSLIDLVEMLADWKASTERNPTGSLARSLPIQRDRFQISDQLYAILWNTARDLDWVTGEQYRAANIGPTADPT